MSFPTSPVNGQQATVGNIVYVYSSSASSWTRVQTGFTSLSITGNVVAGNVIANGNVYQGSVIVPNQDQVVAYIFAF